MWKLIISSAAAVLAAHAADCSRTSTGLVPINDAGFRPYQGQTGGLYPNGSTQRPAAHGAMGMKMAAEIKPRNAAGEVDEANGRAS